MSEGTTVKAFIACAAEAGGQLAWWHVLCFSLITFLTLENRLKRVAVKSEAILSKRVKGLGLVRIIGALGDRNGSHFCDIFSQ
jgi:hypothetical protein